MKIILFIHHLMMIIKQTLGKEFAIDDMASLGLIHPHEAPITEEQSLSAAPNLKRNNGAFQQLFAMELRLNLNINFKCRQWPGIKRRLYRSSA